jgi:transcriptional regulator with XRE-family HTH domain
MLSANIKALRKNKRLSQEQLANKAGVTFSTLSKVEAGLNKNPTLETMLKIASVFDVGLDDLVGRPHTGKIKREGNES